MNPISLAEYILFTFSDKSRGGITPMKLQKLLYYVKAWGLVAGHDLVDGDFLRWDYGPVNEAVWKKYNGRSPITPQPPSSHPKGKEKKLIDFIVYNYVQYNALTLSSMTHEEKPWKNTPPNDVIPDDLMLEYYRERPFAKNFASDEEWQGFVPVDSDFSHSFALDMTKEDAEEVNTYSSFEEYKRHQEEASEDFESWFNDL